MEGLAILTNISLILLLGLLGKLLAKKLKLSSVLVLILLGMALQILVMNGLFQFTPVFLISVSTLAIVMIIFDGTSRFQWKEFDQLSLQSLKIVGWFTLASVLLLSFFAMLFIFEEVGVIYYLYGMIFSSILIATDPSSLFIMMGNVKHKVITLLELESIINTPLTVLLPFVILDLINTVGEVNLVASFLYQVLPFLQQIIVGVGSGVVVGIIVFKIMKNVYSEQLSPIALITAALLSYILAENMKGSGVLAVATLGLFFGSIYVKQKATLQEFSSLLSTSLEILVFVLVGLMISIPLSLTFLLKSLLLFLVLLVCRGLAVFYTLRNEKFNTTEKMFAVLNMPKGIAMAVVIFTFTVLNIAMINLMLDYLLAMLIYALILSTIVTRNSKKFIRVDIQKKMEESS